MPRPKDLDKLRRTWVKPKILLGFTILVGFGLLAVSISYQSFLNLTQIYNTTSDPSRKLVQINSIMADIYAAERSIRTYTLTQNEQFLDLYFITLVNLDGKVDTLLHMAQNNPEQRTKILSIQSLLYQKGQILHELLAIREAEMQSRPFDEALRELDRLSMDTSYIPSVITSSVITKTSRKDSIINRPQAEPQKGVFNRLRSWFTRSETIDTTITRMLVEVETQVDTIARVRSPSDSLIGDVLRVLYDIQLRQRETMRIISTKEMEILRSDRQIMDQIRNIVALLEEEELANSHSQLEATKLVVKRSTDSILLMGGIALLIMIFFIGLIFRDISRSSYYQSRLLDAKLLAEKLLRIKEEFLSNMSHEIRTPLSAIIGFTNQLRKTNLNDKQALYIDSLGTSGEHLLQIVNDILDLSKIDAGQMRIEAVPFKPVAVLQEAVNLFGIKAREKGLSIELSADDELNLLVEGDPLRLKQIIFNLVSNAIKFTCQGGVSVRAYCHALKGNRIEFCFEVEDTGIGIEEEDLERVFERFSQADSSTTRSYGGTGLGLTIVTKLLELQGGSIKLRSTPGQGSNFSFLLSYNLLFEAPPTASELAKPLDLKLNISQEQSVIAIDDDPMSRLLLSELLKSLGVFPTILASPIEALELIREKPFAFILTDIQMPLMSGFELLTQVRTLYPGKPSPVVLAFTANSMDDDPQRYQKAGFDGLLIKPFDEYKLYNLLAPFLYQEKVEIPFEEALPDEDQPFDLSEIMRFSNGDSETLRLIVNSFIENSTLNMKQLGDAYAANQWARVQEITHRMKSGFRQFRANSVANLIQEVELTCCEKSTPTELFDTLRNEVHKVLSLLSQAIERVDA